MEGEGPVRTTRRDFLLHAGLTLGALAAGCNRADPDGLGVDVGGDDDTSSVPDDDTASPPDDDTASPADDDTAGDDDTSPDDDTAPPPDDDTTPSECALTPEGVLGPNYIEGAPLRDDIRGGLTGTLLVIQGYVRDASCNPIAGAELDVWHAYPEGGYSSADTFDLRGRLLTDETGAFRLTTLRPGYELSETGLPIPLHIHVRIRVGGALVLTTQLYLRDDPVLEDPMFAETDPALIMDIVEDGPDSQGAEYDFHVDPS